MRGWSRCVPKMIEYYSGSLFDSTADALAHGCNTIGKMGAGIAREFKERYPEMYRDYVQRCREKTFLPGQGYLFRNPEKPHIINLATQAESLARIEYVDSAFAWLRNSYRELEIRSVAMPRIASGLGALDWEEVHTLLRRHLGSSDLLIQVWKFHP